MASFTETLNSTSFNETVNTTSLNETQQMNSGAPSSLLIFKGIMLSVLTFLSISANSLTLVILHKYHEINPVTKVFLTSMTVADLTLAFLLLPSIPAVAVDRWPFGTTFCSITGFLNTGLVTRSILSLLCVTFEPFLAVTRPYQYPTLMTVKRARIIVLGICPFGNYSCSFNLFCGRSFCLWSQSAHVSNKNFTKKLHDSHYFNSSTSICTTCVDIDDVYSSVSPGKISCCQDCRSRQSTWKEIRQESIYHIFHNDCLSFCTVGSTLYCICLYRATSRRCSFVAFVFCTTASIFQHYSKCSHLLLQEYSLQTGSKESHPFIHALFGNTRNTIKWLNLIFDVSCYDHQKIYNMMNRINQSCI